MIINAALLFYTLLTIQALLIVAVATAGFFIVRFSVRKLKSYIEDHREVVSLNAKA